MPETRATVQQLDRAGLIEIRLDTLQQLFNSFDPAPFHHKDLDEDAEEYIVGSVDEHPLASPLRLVLYLPRDQLALAEQTMLERAIHNYFAYRLDVMRRRMRFLFRSGRVALVIALLFLAACTSIRQLVLPLWTSAASGVLNDALLIAGWVAMWRPLQIFLYDWWPIRHTCRLYAKLAAIPVELRPTP